MIIYIQYLKLLMFLITEFMRQPLKGTFFNLKAILHRMKFQSPILNLSAKFLVILK